MENLDWGDIWNRGAWTFLQAFFATAAAAGTGFVDVSVLQSAALAGGAAVISFLKNVFVQSRSA